MAATLALNLKFSYQLGILKLFDIVKVFNILFVQHLNQNLQSDLLGRKVLTCSVSSFHFHVYFALK